MNACGGAAVLKMLLSRTAAASFSKLFAHFRIQTIHLSHRAVVGWIRRNNIDFVSVMLDTIKDRLCKRAVITTELVVPATWVIL